MKTDLNNINSDKKPSVSHENVALLCRYCDKFWNNVCLGLPYNKNQRRVICQNFREVS